MSESGWLGLATLIVNAIGAGFLIYMKYKMASLQSGINDGNVANQKILNETESQTAKIDENRAKLETVHADINGRVQELIAAQVKIELAKVVGLQILDKDKAKK